MEAIDIEILYKLLKLKSICKNIFKNKVYVKFKNKN